MPSKMRQATMFQRGEDTPLFSGVAMTATAEATQIPDPAGGEQIPMPVVCATCLDTGQVGKFYCWCRAADRLRHSRRKRRPSMQVSIERILKAHGQLTAFRYNPGFYIKLTMDGYQPLSIEHLPVNNQVSIAHTFVQNGDLMWDPMIVFDLPTWEPVEIEQSPVGHYSRRFSNGPDGQPIIDKRFRRDVMELVNTWAKNLRYQEWDRATVAKLLTGENPEL